MSSFSTKYTWDIERAIDRVEKAFGRSAGKPVGDCDASFMNGVSAACGKILVEIQKERTYQAEWKEPTDE